MSAQPDVDGMVKYRANLAAQDAAEATEASRVRALYPDILAELQRLHPLAGWVDVADRAPDPDDWRQNHEREIFHAFRADDGREVYAVPAWPKARNGATRICWQGRYPRTEAGEQTIYGSDNPPSINTSSSQPPRRIARDITRRLLPAYGDVFAICEERAAGSNRYADDRAEGVAKLLTETHAEPYGQQQSNPRLHVPSTTTDAYEGYAVLIPYNDRVNIELSSIPYAVAVRLLNIAFPRT
jgi:hypothetical protein